MSAELRFPWDSPSAPVGPPGAADDPPARPKPKGRRPASVNLAATAATGVTPAWRYHHLTISGPAAAVTAFAAAARGSGVTPWRVDGAEVEETVFNLAVTQPASRRTLTVDGCRILARQFRDRVERRQAQAAMLVGTSLACPFDLHTLLPVPPAILQLGPTHPAALDWLQTHWGITDRLRQVTVREKATTGRRLPNGHAVSGYGFFTAGGVAQASTGTSPRNDNGGETPQAAIDQLGARWPTLRFQLVPRPAT